MTMKKKILTTLSVVLVLGMAALGILAYLMDEDSDVNVMALGNVYIDQIEDFEQGADLYPGVEVKKEVSVKNIGESAAYVRTLVAFETIDGQWPGYVPEWNNAVAVENLNIQLEKDGVKYDVYEVVYADALEPGEETDMSLMSVKLHEDCKNEHMEALGGTYEVLVLSQAGQYAGFENVSAAEALDTMFGEPTEAKVAEWFGGEEFDVIYVSTAQELVEVLKDIRDVAKPKIKDGEKEYRVKANIVLTGDIIFDSSDLFMYTESNGAPLHFYGVDGNLILNGHKIVATENALLSGKAHANAVLLFQYSNVKIVGDGEIVANNKSIPVYAWANCTVDIYGGNYVTNASERNESAVYVNNASAKVNVYGGTYTDSDYAFNVHDNCGNTTTIVLHEGVTYKEFLKSGTIDVIQNDINNGRIVYAEGCEFKTDVIDGETWYQVIKK